MMIEQTPPKEYTRMKALELEERNGWLSPEQRREFYSLIRIFYPGAAGGESSLMWELTPAKPTGLAETLTYAWERIKP